MNAVAEPNSNSKAFLEQIKFLHAYLECSDSIQQGVHAMLRIVFDSDSTEDEVAMAKHTIADALYPNPHKGKLGMDLAESEAEAASENEELMQIVQEMNAEEDTFASRLEVAIDRAGLSQTELAKKIGIGQPAISNMLNRECRPQRRTILRLAEALGVEPAELWPGIK